MKFKHKKVTQFLRAKFWLATERSNEIKRQMTNEEDNNCVTVDSIRALLVLVPGKV